MKTINLNDKNELKAEVQRLKTLIEKYSNRSTAVKKLKARLNTYELCLEDIEHEENLQIDNFNLMAAGYDYNIFNARYYSMEEQ